MCGSILQKILPRIYLFFLSVFIIHPLLLSTSGQAFEAPKSIINQNPNHWEQRRLMMKGGKIKNIADQCQKLTQHHGIMAERASGWLYNHAVPYAGNNAFIDHPTFAYEDKRIILIHKWLTDESRWERYGAAVPGTLDRCYGNAQNASQQIINIMTKFGAVYIPDQNNWIEGWAADN